MQKLTELHLHLDGSLRPETVWELAEEQQIRLPAADLEELRYQMKVPEDCQSLHECLKRFDLPLLVLQEADALERVTFELTEDLAKEGVTYAEIRFAPQQSMEHGLTQDQAVEAAIRGAKRGMEMYPSIRVGLILCCMRGGEEAAGRRNGTVVLPYTICSGGRANRPPHGGKKRQKVKKIGKARKKSCENL